MYLRCFTSARPKEWVTWLPWVQYCYNTSINSSTSKTPFEVLYGKVPPSILSYVHGSCPLESIENFLLERDQIIRNVRAQLQIAQNRMKKVYDGKHVERSFQVGERVYLKLHPYRQHTVARRSQQKLAPKWFGPFLVLARIGEVAYKLELPVGSKVHPVFHVSLLKKTLGAAVETHPTIPADFYSNEDVHYLPQAILDSRMFRGKLQLLIHWQELTPAEATWEDASDFITRFPYFNLADKVVFKEEGIVT